MEEKSRVRNEWFAWSMILLPMHGASQSQARRKPMQRGHETRWNSHYVLHSDESDVSSKGNKRRAGVRYNEATEWSAVTRLDAFPAFIYTQD